MKINRYILPIALACGMLAGCSNDEIVFDHELPAFDTKEGSILLEVIAPKETPDDAKIFISGEFNGGDKAAIGDLRWQLEKSSKISGKWGIYLDPTTFIQGKSLADGYHFVSDTDGEERTALGDTVVRTLSPEPGTRTNIYVSKWKSFFDKPVEIVHDGYVVYVEDNTGWDATALYCYGDKEVCGAWPGKLPDGTETIDGKTYKYFDMGAVHTGMTLTFIFNNNNGGQQVENFDVLKKNVLNKNYFFSIDATTATAVDVAQNHWFYVLAPAWDALALYTWGNDVELFGSWPGTVADASTATIVGNTYRKIAIPASATGQMVNAIFNNNNGGEQAADLNIAAIEERDYYILVQDKVSYEVNPQKPEPPTAPETSFTIYIEDKLGWDLYVHYWVDGGITTTWPGSHATETKEVDGVTYKYFAIDKQFEGQSVGVIFSNNGSDTERFQTSAVFDSDKYYRLESSGVSEVKK